ncbi:MAG: hypothetical protein DWQ07_16945 [Chloroflexi bacterium]|nr:MAG: hypothetical protein DWQ07_16945 [Chloroflexota bacterium]MBL1195092.1 hypothetical protein [Chloroflexota bacterium]NOH12378.1 mechanosensitive ion channel [Chloroflexota bacterium]
MFDQIIDQLLTLTGDNLINLLIGLGILVGGWIIARIVAFVVRRVLKRTNLDNRFAGTLTEEDGAPRLQIERWISTGVFWLIMLFVLIAFFQTVQLTAVSAPLSTLLDELLLAAPNLLGAVLILFIAWIIGSLAKLLVSRALRMTRFEERLGEQAELEEDRVDVSESLATGVFWLVFLLFLPAVLSALGMQGLVAPVQAVASDILSVVPNIIGAVVLLAVGWFIARIVRQIVTNLLAATNIDSLGERVGVTGEGRTQPLSKIIGSVVYILVLIPAVIAALNSLEIDAISGPAITMLTTVVNGIPAFFGAAVILGVAYFAGRLVAGLVSNLLTGIGFNNLPKVLGLEVEPAEGQATLSEMVGYIVVVAVMMLAAVEAANLLGFDILAVMIADFTGFGLQALLALVIFAIGLYLANITRSVVLSAAGLQATFAANLSRIAVLVFVGALALQQLGIAGDIVNLAFGILLGAIGIATALAFGLGSREIAGRQVERWLTSMQGSTSTDKQ